MSATIETIIIVLASLSMGSLIPMFWKKVLGTPYLTKKELTETICPGCSKDMNALKENILRATTEDRRKDMQHFKEDVHDKLSKIMAVLLIMALKKEGEEMSAEDRTRIIEMVAGQKAG